MKCLIFRLKLALLGQHQAQSVQQVKGPKVRPWVIFSIQAVLRFVLYRLLACLEGMLRAWLSS